MAGRIRSIKPELLEDAKTAGLTHEAFRLFIGLLLLADDHGNLRAHPKQLEGAVFWARENLASVSELLREMSKAGLIVVYNHSGQPYAHICGWTKHQKVDHPSKPRLPLPQDGVVVDYSAESSETLGNPRENLAKDSTTLAPDQDHRPGPSTIDQDHRPHINPEGAPAPNGAPSGFELSPPSDDPDRSPSADVSSVWAAYLDGWHRTIGSGKPPVLGAPRRRQIRARLKTYSVDDLRRAAAALWASTWHVENGRTYPELVFRSDEQVEKLLAKSAPEPDDNVPSVEDTMRFLAERDAREAAVQA